MNLQEKKDQIILDKIHGFISRQIRVHEFSASMGIGIYESYTFKVDNNHGFFIDATWSINWFHYSQNDHYDARISDFGLENTIGKTYGVPMSHIAIKYGKEIYEMLMKRCDELVRIEKIIKNRFAKAISR